jgi:hypothetical protein
VEDKVNAIKLKVELGDLEDNKIERLRHVLLNYPGPVEVDVWVKAPQGELKLKLGDRFHVNPNAKFVQEVDNVFQKSVVVFNQNDQVSTL